jgi:hypothetical protein
MVRGMRTAGILAVTALSLAAFHGPARADTGKALAAARAGLPADAKFMFGLDIAALSKTQLFATYYPKLKNKPDAAKLLDAVKDGCKLDPVAVVQGVVVAMSADQQDGAAYVAISGIDKARLSSCIQQVTQAGDKDAKVTLKQDGNITSIAKGSDTAFFGWAGKDVIVVSLHTQDKSTLVKWMGGKGALAKSDLGKALARVNTSAAIWGAGVGDKEVEPGVTVKGGYGQVTYAKGNVSAEVHAMMGSAAEATKMAASTSKQLDEAKQSGQIPAELIPVVKAIAVAADKDGLRVTASMPEKDLMGALSAVAGSLGGP